MRNQKWALALTVVALGLSFAWLPRESDLVILAVAQEKEAVDPAVEAFEAGFESLITGQYRAARNSGRRLAAMEGHEAAGLWLQVRAIRESDHPKHAVELLKDKSGVVTADPRLQHEWGQIQILTGDYAGAEATGRALIEREAKSVRGRALRGESLWQRGKYEEAIVEFRAAATGTAMVVVGERDPDNFELAEEMHASGWACYRMNDLHLAQSRFDVGRRAYRRHAPCLIGLALIFYETNKDASARQNYCEVVYGSLTEEGFNPNYAPAHLIAAYTYLFRWRGGDGAQSMQKAMRANRFYPELLVARAVMLITSDQYAEGVALAERALDVNPNMVSAIAALALKEATLSNQDAFKTLEARALAINPKAGEFYHIVADGLSSRHRFVEAIEAYRKGIELEPRRWTLYRDLGRALLNTGDHEGGEEMLKTAHRNDMLRNSVHTYNLLQLLGTYKYFKRYEMDDGRYSVLIYEDETDIVEPYYRKELERVTRELGSKYTGYEPAKPVVIESFHRHGDFEVRTVGIEGLPALGACFGRLVTLDSPSARPPGTYNWASTLWHEMDHVYQLQMSNGQIPRWLAEGCSVYEEGRNRPEWRRYSELELFNTWATDGLPKVKEFNAWFGDGSRVMFAYYLGSVMVEYIVRDYGGYATVITMIREFAAKKTPEEVFRDILKIDMDEFDRGFRDFVAQRVSSMQLLPPVRVESLDDLQIKAEDDEASTEELVTLARAHLQNGRIADARMWAGKAQAQGAKTAELHYVLGMLAPSQPGSSQTARMHNHIEHLEAALKLGLKDYNLFMALARANQQFQKWPEYIDMLERARRAFPTSTAPLRELYQYRIRGGELDRAHQLAEDIARLDENDLAIREWLLNRYVTSAEHAKTADIAMQMIYVNPFMPLPHESRARALKEMGEWEEAVFEWEMFARASNRAPEPAARRAAAVAAGIGKVEVWIAAKEYAKARRAAADTLALNPDEPRAQALEARIAAAEAAAAEKSKAPPPIEGDEKSPDKPVSTPAQPTDQPKGE